MRWRRGGWTGTLQRRRRSHGWNATGLEAGVDTLYLSEILGHSSVSITAGIYQHTREERLVGAVQQVGDAIFGRHEAQ